MTYPCVVAECCKTLSITSYRHHSRPSITPPLQQTNWDTALIYAVVRELTSSALENFQTTFSGFFSWVTSSTAPTGSSILVCIRNSGTFLYVNEKLRATL